MIGQTETNMNGSKHILGKIEHPIGTRKGGRMLYISDDVIEFHEAYKSN
jgi:hypothetical protein